MTNKDVFRILNSAQIKGPSCPDTAVVLTAFGTTRQSALEIYALIDAMYRKQFEQYEIRWAFTSKRVRQCLLEQGIRVNCPIETARELKRDGYDRAVFQSLHVVPGEEFEKVNTLIVPGLSITTGKPLLDTPMDLQYASKALLRDIGSDEVTVFVTHGNEKYPRYNRQLIQLQQILQQRKSNGFLCSIEGDPPGTGGLASAKQLAQTSGSVTFVPLMLVDGIHIADDVMGENDDSWSRRVGAKETLLRPPLGARPDMCKLFIQHTQDALKDAAEKQPVQMTMTKSPFQQCKKGHFYAVGVGPGSPDMMTVRAQQIVATADVVIAPKSKKGDRSMALTAVSHLISGQHVENCVYPMNRNTDETNAFWRKTACKAAAFCMAQKSVVHITIGDPLIYSTCCYLLRELEGMIPKKHIHVIPGISAFQSASALFQEALTLQEDRMMLMPATDMRRVESALKQCETLVLYKVASRIEALCEMLEKNGKHHGARLVCYAEDAVRQYTTRSIREALVDRPGYMSTVIVHLNRCLWQDVTPTHHAEK